MLMPAVQRARQAGDVTDIRNELRQIAVAYRNYLLGDKRGPKSQVDLSPLYENSSRINEDLDKRRITVIWRISDRNIDSKTILANETHADRLGRRLVAMGDASVQTMDEQEFKSALKAQIVP